MKDKRRPDLFKFFGWFSAALSLLNLINELSPFEILGKLNKWLSAYVVFVEAISSFLFGWINIDWINVSSRENHLLVIAFVLIMSFHRAQVRFETDKGEPRFSARVSSLFISSLWLLGCVLLALFLSGNSSLWALGLGMLLLCRFYFSSTDRMDGLPDRKVIFKELTGVVTSLMVLILLNYTVFN